MQPLSPALATALALTLAGPAPGRAASDAGRATPAATAPPRLVLVVAVDQLRPDYLARFAGRFRGGLRRLLERGAVFTQARYRHACSDTAPGHAVILSGRSPRSSGIVGNRWYDLALRRRVNVVDDPTVAVLGGEAGRAASPASFVGFSLGDVLKRRTPGARVVGVSIKDRAAILLAGPRADAAYWYGGGGRFVTSSHYMPAAPAWLEAWNARRVADAYAGRTWQRLLGHEAPYLELAGRDDVAGEWDRKDTVFPHRLPARPPAEEFYEGLWRTPFGDEVLLDLALEAAARHGLGRRGVTDLFAVSFSALDYVGHTYGPDSQEVMDHLLRLDQVLERLLDELERRVGAGRLLVVLTSDHGVLPLVEVLQERGVKARRADPQVLEDAVAGALRARFPGHSGLVLQVGDGGVTFDLEALRAQGLRRADVERVVTQALLDTGLVAAVYTEAHFAGEPPAGDPWFELYRRCRFGPRSPHLELRLEQNVYLDARPGGTGHGGPYDHDRHVPIVFLGASVRAGTHALPCGPEDIAPALARLLELDYPMQDAEQDLTPFLR